MSVPKSFRQTIGLAPSSVSASADSALIVIDAQGTCSCPQCGAAR